MRMLLKLLIVTATIASVWSPAAARAQSEHQPRLTMSAEALSPLSEIGERVTPRPPARLERSQDKVADGAFWAVAELHVGLMLADTATTFALLRRCPQCRENDPYTAPVIAAGPKVAYPAAIAFGTGVMTLSWWMKHEHSRLPWWVLPVAVAAGNAVCIASNARY